MSLLTEKAYGLMFTPEHAALMRDGRKTQTRRVLKHKPTRAHIGECCFSKTGFAEQDSPNGRCWCGNTVPIRRPHEGDLFYVKTRLFMPRSEATDYYRVTRLWVHRVQDIPIWDQEAEGYHPYLANSLEWFKTAWDQINSKRAPWASNPWVVAREFVEGTE